MVTKRNRRVTDSDSLYDDIDVVLSAFGDIKVSRFYSEGDKFLTLSSDYDIWRKNSKEIINELKNLGYDFNTAGGSGDRVMLDFQKRVTDSKKKVKDSAIHPNEVFDTIKEMFEEEIPEYAGFYKVETHDGSSYDGFISFCDGWVEATAPVYPRPIGDSAVWMSDESCTKILEALEDTDPILEDIYEYNEQYQTRYATVEDFKEAYYNQEMDDFEEIDETVYSWYEEPAFIKVRLLLNGNVAELGAYFNDDLGYGRESVGSWAGKNVIGEPYGDHTIIEYREEFENYDELYAFVAENLPKVFGSFEIRD